jgi:hypothetical protein
VRAAGLPPPPPPPRDRAWTAHDSPQTGTDTVPWRASSCTRATYTHAHGSGGVHATQGPRPPLLPCPSPTTYHLPHKHACLSAYINTCPPTWPPTYLLSVPASLVQSLLYRLALSHTEPSLGGGTTVTRTHNLSGGQAARAKRAPSRMHMTRRAWVHARRCTRTCTAPYVYAG